jgi:hypothetical protein
MLLLEERVTYTALNFPRCLLTAKTGEHFIRLLQKRPQSIVIKQNNGTGSAPSGQQVNN